MKKAETKADSTASQNITNYIAEVGGWKGEMLGRLRAIIRAAGPDLTEEWKWGTPVWSQNGNVVAISAFKDHVKANFFQGAALADPKKLFNAGLEAKTTRAIDFHEGDKLNEAALKELVRAAIARNTAGSKKK